MNAAQATVDESEPLSWREICARYPDQYVCLVDFVDVEPGGPMATARVVGYGSTHDAAFEPIRELPKPFPLCAVRFTGTPRTPLIRPWLIFDDDEVNDSFRA